MWHNVLAKLRHMGAIIECEGEVGRRQESGNSSCAGIV